jgi:hypothetical protein
VFFWIISTSVAWYTSWNVSEKHTASSWFEYGVPTAVAFWVVVLYSFVERYQHSGGNRWLHLPKMEASSFSETLVTFYQSTRRHNSDDSNLHMKNLYRYENLSHVPYHPNSLFYSMLYELTRWYTFVKLSNYHASDMLHIIPQSDRIFFRDIFYSGYSIYLMSVYLNTIWGLYCDLSDYDLVNNATQHIIIWSSVSDLLSVDVLLGLGVKLHEPVTPCTRGLYEMRADMHSYIINTTKYRDSHFKPISCIPHATEKVVETF